MEIPGLDRKPELFYNTRLHRFKQRDSLFGSLNYKIELRNYCGFTLYSICTGTPKLLRLYLMWD
jgi:hypothetical protein